MADRAPPPNSNRRAPREPRASREPRAPRTSREPRAPRTAGLWKRLVASPRSRALLWGGGSLLAVLLLAAGLLYLGYGRHHGPGKGDTALEIDWPPGLTSEQAAARLVELGLADNQETLAVFLHATGGTDDFVPGPHLLPEGASPWDLRRFLSRSFFRPFTRITIPEGFNRFDIAARLEKLKITSRKRFLAATVDPAALDEAGVPRREGAAADSAEGYLFPATYDLPLDAEPREVIKRFVTEANRRWDIVSAQHKDGLASLHASLGWDRRDVLTLASMIEKEAAVDEERPLIASVFLNRLLDPNFRPKRLQCDPTSMYGCLAFPEEAPSCADWNGKPIAAIHHDPKNRYSTYTHTGLPPGPIANPGVKSIAAVLAPAATKYLYFVAQGGGRHTFSQDLDAHNDAVHKGKP